ncbi:MAG TPA: GNAT family N-acetyltransferase [Dehalococcoidia bacterium]|nr:GNAT family N-acetyltransferase [Dehalococcoidia bacterium]
MTQAVEPQQAMRAAPRKMTPADRAAAAQALARAFYDDPFTMYVFPDDAYRAKMLPRFFADAIKLAAPRDESFVHLDPPVGAALWLPPGKHKISLGRMAPLLLRRLPQWRPRPLIRFLSIMGELEKKHITHDHWYLMILGVDPPMQGQGIGGLLMSDVLGRADASGLDCYLETQKERNVPFYQRHGFDVVETYRCDGGRGPQFWTMLRKPR